MDQVVAAYAEMERALGVQILCSQPAKPPPADDTEKETQGKRKKPKSKMQRIAEEGKENEVPRASAQAEKLGEEGRVVFVQKKDAFKAPKNVAQKAQQTARPGDAKLGAGLVACGGSKQNRKEIETTPAGSNMLAAGKAKKKASKKKAVAKVDAPNEGATFSPPLPALAESAPTPDQRSVGVSPGGSGFQPFFWTGGQVGTQDPEGGTQLRPTQASPPISFSDLVSSGKKGAKSLKEDTPAPGGVVTGKKTDGREGAKAAKKGKKVTGGGAGKENGEKAAREEFYSCEDDTAFDAFLQEDGVGSPEASLPIAPSATGEAKGEQKNSGKGKKGGVKKGAKAPKRDAVKSRTESATESLAAPERAKLKAEIRASVAAAVGATQTLSGSASHDARLTAGGEGKVTSAEEKVTSASERKPKQRAPAAGKRKRGSVAETADASEATGVSAVLTGVNAAAAPSTTPHVSKKPAGEIGKTPSVPAKTPGLKTPADNGLCPSTSRPLDSGGPPVFCEKPACGFCGLSDDSDVAGKLVRKGAAPIGLLAAEGFEERGADNESGGKRKRVQLASVVVHELCAQW